MMAQNMIKTMSLEITSTKTVKKATKGNGKKD